MNKYYNKEDLLTCNEEIINDIVNKIELDKDNKEERITKKLEHVTLKYKEALEKRTI